MANDEVIPNDQPIDVKTVKILLNGEEMNNVYGIEAVSVFKEVNKIPSAQITIIDGDVSKRKFEASDSGDFDPGTSVEIKAGYGGSVETIFKGVIVRQGVKITKSKNSVLRIEAKDEYAGLCIGRKNAYFYDSLDSDIISEILKTHKDNYQANIDRDYTLTQEIEDTELEHTEMIQYYVSDWDFIVTRAEKNGMLVNVSDGNFKVDKPTLSGDPALTLLFGATMFEFESEIDAYSQYKSIESSSWNMSDQETEVIESVEPNLEDQGKLSGADLSKVFGIDVLGIQRPGSIADQELQQWADARLLKSRLARIRGRVKCQGYSGVVPGDVIEIKGVGDHYNGKVFVSGTRHVITDENWELDIQFGLKEDWFSETEDIVDTPASGLVPAINGLHVGVVTQIEGDPESEFRMLVRAPMISGEDDGVWARVAQLDAGDGRGTYFRPEIGDEVILGFLNCDPRNAVVLGALHSSKLPSPIEPSDDNDQKGIISRNGMQLLFDDKDNIIQLETEEGKNKIHLTEKDGGIFIEDENGNKIEMSSDGILIESAGDINLKASGDINLEGMNIAGAANSEVKFEGTSGAEISTNGVAVIKGSLVQIN